MKAKKNMVIGILCLTLVFMGIGYAFFSTTLNITGTSQGSGTFDVRITNVVPDSNNTSGGVNAMDPIGNDYAVTEATLVANFNAPGDYITYNITVTNRGSIDAVIEVDVGTDASGAYTLTCDVDDGEEVLANGGTITFPCTMTFDAGHNLSAEQYASLTTAHMTVRVNVVQKATYDPGYIDQDDSCFISVIPGEINYYDTSKAGCGTTTTIPDNLRLKTSTVTGYTVNETACQMFAPLFGTTCTQVKDDIADLVANYGYDDPNNGLYATQYAMFVDPQIGSLNQNFYEIDTIGIAAFASKNLTSVSLSDNITEIKDFGFSVNNLTSVSLPQGLQSTGFGSFAYNHLNGILTIPASVTSIGASSFDGYDASYAYQTRYEIDNSNNITALVFELGSQLRVIGPNAFQFNQLTTLTLPVGLLTVMDRAFQDNPIAGTLTIPDSVTTIEEGAFDSILVEELHLGSNITSIGYAAFHMKNSTDLKDVYVDMTESDWNSNVTKDSDIFSGNPTMHYNEP